MRAPIVYMEKVAIHIKDLGKIYKGVPRYRLGKRVEFYMPKHSYTGMLSQMFYSTSPKVVDRNIPAGIYTVRGGAGKLFGFLSDKLGKKNNWGNLRPGVRRGVNEFLLSHEANEYRAMKELLPKLQTEGIKLTDTLNPIKTRDRRKYKFMGHIAPKVLMQDNNMAATLKGRDAKAVSNEIINMRSLSKEKEYMESLLREMGYKNYEFGKQRFNRREIRAISDKITRKRRNTLGIPSDFIERVGHTYYA